jgi:radical SAM superfamily enzyme YgiQ (UPF0313 family)
MRILLIHAEFPCSYWGFQHALPLTGRRAVMPPLGLCTVAALLPAEWELRLVDLNIEPLDDATLAWAEAVLIGGMLVQAPSMQQLIGRVRAAGRRCVVGGPAATTAPELFAEADVVFQGEVEGRSDALVEAIRGDGPARVATGPLPPLGATTPPRYDLVRRDLYTTMALQTSRGCPYACEFCDVVEIFGRTPRVKPAEAVVGELDRLYRLGWRGNVFVVDDNFIGNLKAARALLPAIAAWQERHGHPFELYTEASVNLAREEALLAAMVRAGFTAVFVGIETPSTSALREVGKTQNLRVDLGEAVERITRAGLEVMGGFIVGFDSDDATTFAAQRDFLADAPIPLAMVGLLTALPGTALWRRLERTGRLRRRSGGDQFDRPNFEPAMDEAALLEGYADLLATLYAPDAYGRRCRAAATRLGPRAKRRLRPDALRIAARAVWQLGVRGPRRALFWRLVGPALLRSPAAIEAAITHAAQGEHLIRYTHEDVLPRLRRALTELRRERATRSAA